MNNFYLKALLYGVDNYIGREHCADLTPEDEKYILKAYSIANECQNPQTFTKASALCPILETIGQNFNETIYGYPAKEVELNQSYFPQKNLGICDYSPLFDKIKECVEKVKNKTSLAQAETLLSYLEKYASTIPYANIRTDVSLFDYVKSSTAEAICMKMADKNKEKPFLIIGGDFSGIQPYIYQIVSKYAGKNLKGRSYYVKLLSDTIVNSLLNELSLYRANIIYNSGGGFYILAPNTDQNIAIVQSFEKKIEQHLFKEHGNTLSLSLAYVEMGLDVLEGKSEKKLNDYWKELFEKRDLKKHHKFSNLIEEDAIKFFKPHQYNPTNIETDDITGEEILPSETKKEGGLTLKYNTYNQIKLGQVLRDTKYIVCSKSKQPKLDKKEYFCIEPCGLQIYYYFIDNNNEDKLLSKLEDIKVIILNNSNFEYLPLSPSSYIQFEYYGGNEFNGNSFEQMCDVQSFNKLGVLRMDVDNLGYIFQQGINNSRVSMARYSALSRSFDYFFSGYLNTIVNEIGRENLFIVYSGGDDVFAVGLWNKVIDMAKHIREDFRKFTCNNPNFSISGGIAIVDVKFPIMKAAEISGQEESNAKNHTCGELTKSSISFMQMPLNWDTEFGCVEELKNTLVKHINDESLPKSFLSKINLHYQSANIQQHQINNYKTYWMITYDLSRLKSRNSNGNWQQIVENCKNEIVGNKKQLNGINITTDYHPLELWAFACRWAEFETRKDNIN